MLWNIGTNGKFLIRPLFVFAETFSKWIMLWYANRADLSSNDIIIELKDLEAELLSMVCKDVEVEPVLQDIAGEELNRVANIAPDAQLDC